MRLPFQTRVRRDRGFRASIEGMEARRLLANAAADVLTYHDDNARTGADPHETVLTPSNVNASSFGKKFTAAVDGAVYAQPLYMANVTIHGKGVHNVVIVATAHDSVYAFDADAPGAPLWKTSFLDPAHGVMSVPTVQDWQLDLSPEIGVTGTPVIDPSTGTIYVAAKTEVQSAGPKDTYTLHALDIRTGAEKLGGPVVIQPSVPGRGAGHVKGTVSFQAYYQAQRPALLLENGVVYVAFGSLGDHSPYHGWVVGYAANTLRQVAAFNTTPNSNGPGGNLGGIWMTGDGPAADASGNIYLLSGSGTFGPARPGGNYSDAALKLTPTLQVVDYFAPRNTSYLDKRDLDLGSGGSILIPAAPGSPHTLLVGGGKVGTLFSIDTSKMGRQTRNNPHVQAIANALTPNIKARYTPIDNNPPGAIFSTPAYSNGMLYVNAVGDVLRQYAVVNGKLVGPVAASSRALGYPGANMTVSSNGASDGIVWTLENSGTRTPPAPAVLHAYNAANVSHELYNSNQSGTRDQPGSAVKFSVPTVANGKVYVATKNGLTVYGLLH